MRVVNKRPSDKNWSGNPIHYQLYSAAAEADSTIVFEIKVMFRRADDADYREIIILPYSPVKGFANIDIDAVIDGVLEYETPNISPDNEFLLPFNCRKMTGRVYIAFREITAADPDPAWIETENDKAKFVIKGGISFSKWRGDNFWVNYYDPLKPFLTWQQSGRLASKSERMYLAWMNDTAVEASNIKMRRIICFNDGTQHVVDYNASALPLDVVFFPTGYNQLKLGDVDPTKRVHYWELQIRDTHFAVALSEAYRYYLDNRNDRNDVTLNYRNSLGGLDSARVRGVIEFNLDRNFEKTESLVIHNYFEGNNVSPRVKAANSTETLVYKGDIGYLSKEEQDRLRDAHFRRECWWEQQKKWMPIMILTGGQKLTTSMDQLWNMPIEFSIADGGDKYYTPRNVNLAEGALPSGSLCSAVITVPTYAVDDDGYHIDWDLTSGAPVKYQVMTPGVAGGAPYETTDTEFTFPWLPAGDNVIRVTPFCFIGGNYIAGSPKEVTITVAPACVGVGIVGAPGLPDAIAGSEYGYYFSLSGTAPFTLSNVVKPAWMNIWISGNIVNFSGTPLLSDAAEDVDVSFDITNCSGNNTVSFEDTIDVTGLPYNFKVTNSSERYKINSVSPVYAPISGAFPLTTGQEVTGTHTGISTGVAVSLEDVAGGAAFLILRKNNVNVFSHTVMASETYTFPAITFLPGDLFEILMF